MLFQMKEYETHSVDSGTPNTIQFPPRIFMFYAPYDFDPKLRKVILNPLPNIN